MQRISRKQEHWVIDDDGNVIGIDHGNRIQYLVSAETDPDTGGITSISPAGIPYILDKCCVPIGIAPTGTMAANGAVTLGTALNTTYSGGIWLYLPSGAAYAGSVARFFWTVMSSTTVGTVYDNTYTPGTNSPDIPASPTAIVAAGPGAFTGVTASVTAFQASLSGGTLGKNGSIEEFHVASFNNSAGSKIFTAKLGASTFSGFTLTTQTTHRMFWRSVNAGREDRQIADGYSGLGSTNDVNSLYRLSEDTSITQTVSVTIQHSTATDHIVLENIVFTVSGSL